MPLPPALLKRLASRGLVQKDSSSTEELAKHTSGREEVIAEDYGEMDDPYAYEMQKRPEENYWIETMKRRMADVGQSGYKGCPNKYNIFHKCSLYCVNKWGDGVLEPNREYLKRRNRLLKRYPLPKNWLEIYDYGCGVHYYWNTTDDTVSWLPPGHSDAQVSKCAAMLRRELEEISTGPTEEDMDDDLTEQDIEKILEAPLPTSPKPADSPPPPPQPPAPVLKKPKARDLDKALRHRASRKHKARAEAEPLDPMDPAAYSDIPRGKWSDGLSIESTKSGADPTASGALFQMRPYPSPGAVLQANAASKPRSESKEE